MRKFLFILGLVILVSAMAMLNKKPMRTQASASSADLLSALQQQTGGTVKISYHTGTGKVNYIGASPDHPIPVLQDKSLFAVARPETTAMQFMVDYGSLFGVNDPRNDLNVESMKQADGGRTFVRYQQTYQGIPVLAGEIIVQVTADQQVASSNGEALPDLNLDTAPSITAGTAQQNALAAVAKKYSLDASGLTASAPQLWIYNPVLLGGPGLRINALVWRIEVTPKELAPLRELVLVDAKLGAVALSFNQVPDALNRTVYDKNNVPSDTLPGTTIVRTEGSAASGIADADNAYNFGGATYNFYLNKFGRNSIDNAGLPLISTVRYCPTTPVGACSPPGLYYQNAFWSGSQMVYGNGFTTAEDVVAHEMTHGVTQSESHLFYYMQSGSINESLSDVFGKLVQFSDQYASNPPANPWLLGQELYVGPVRDMKDPTAFNDPDRITSANYACGSADQGGVHTNSGVNNKAMYLMTAGDSFNGQTVTGIGTDKVARIYYEANTNLLTSGSDYLDLYNDLQQACTNLTGQNGITAADCGQVKKALDAVEMSQQPTACPAPEAPVCPVGQTPTYLFQDDIENPASGKWVANTISGSNQWYYPQLPNPYNFDATYATSGTHNIWGYDQESTADYALEMKNAVALPASSTPYFYFKHAYSFEYANYDGGVLEYTTNGTTWQDAGNLFSNNGYNGVISNTDTNPLAGRQGFVGFGSNGYISSRLSLASLAGQSIKFRFRIGTDSSGNNYGWFIDDIGLYTCSSHAVFLRFLPITLKPALTPAQVTLNAIADTHVEQGNSSTNYGTAITMMSGYDDYNNPNGLIMRSLVKFDLSSIPSNATVLTATLRVYYSGYYDYPDTTRTVTAYGVSANWTETGVNWSNAPTYGTAYGSVDLNSGNATTHYWGYYSIDVTNLAKGWVNSSIPNYGIMLRAPEVSGTDSSYRVFYTREAGASYQPQLVVTYKTPLGQAMTSGVVSTEQVPLPVLKPPSLKVCNAGKCLVIR